MKHFLKQRFVGQKPVNNWYQSSGSDPWERPTIKPNTGFQSGRYLLRETPNRMYQWNCRRRKSISTKGKEMLVQQVLENEAFNATKKTEGSKEQGKIVVVSKRDKKSRCYICKKRGHAYWACESRKKLAGIKLKQEIETTDKIIAEERRYPEKVHVIADYMVESTNDYTWNEVWYVSNNYKFHMCPRRVLFKEIHYKFKMI